MKKLVSTIILCLACLGGLEAQNYWKPFGMQGIFLGVSPDGSIYSYYGGSGNGPCFTRSQDEGETWQVVLGYETGFNCNFNSKCFSISPEGRIFLFEGYPYRAFYSDDNGDTWQLTSGAAPLVAGDEAQQICAVNNETLVGVTSNYVFWTTDGGASWDTIRPAFVEDDKYIGDLLANGNGDVYFCLNHDSGGDSGQNIGVYHATLSDMDNWELVAFEGVSINDMEFDPEGNVVCNALVSDNFDGFEHVPGFYAFGSYNTFGIADNGIVYKSIETENNTAVLAYSMDHGETFTEIGEELELYPPVPGSSDGFLCKGYDNHLYFEVRGSYWKSIFSANIIPNKFAPQGAEWYFNVSSFMGSPISYYHMEVLGDTIIQGHQCSVISRQFLGGNGDEQYVYEGNRKVYWYNQTLGRFTILYDFDAEVGESWTCEIDSCAYEVTVTELTYYEGLGHNHQYRAQRVSYDGELGYFGGGTIIEGIGEISGLFPYPYACVGDIYDGQYPDWLRCYLVDGEMVLHLGAYDCDEQGYCWDGTVAESYGGGDGTEENPYQIYTSNQLALLAQQTNNGTGGDAYYKIMENINLANCDGGIQQWISIGTPEHPFTGHFDGWGDTKTILNMHQTITDGDAQPVGGLFGCTNGAEINNVHLAQCYVSGNGKYVGTLVGYAGLTNISNCSIYDGRASTDKQYGIAGGLVGLAGYTYGEQGTSDQIYSIKACQVKEAVKVEAQIVGGVVGQINDLRAKAKYVMDGCAMCGMADGFCVQGGSSAGGIAGQLWYATMVRCSNNQKVVGGNSQGGGCIGGIIGMVGYGSVVKECINNETGQVSGAEGVRIVNAGGIMGAIHSNSSSNIIDCQNFADVSATQCCGGIVGGYHLNSASTPSFIQRCYNHSKVTCHRPENANGVESAGGIVGHVGQGFGNLCIVECGNLGDVVMESEEQGDAGGILGSREEGHVYIVNVFNRGSVSAPIYAGGIIGGSENIGDCTIQNVYNAGEVITGEEIKGAIAYNQQETDHFSDCYWLGHLENHDGVSQGEPLQHSCAFWPTTYFGEWSLDSLQFGHDLVEALNTGAEALVEQYPTVLAMVHRWEYDIDNTNDGFPVFSGIEVGYPFVGTEWYYEIQRENGSITYQHLEYAADTTVSGKEVVIIIRTNTLYDKDEHSEVTREYLYEENGVVYWWNKDLEEFTPLYDFGAEVGDEWEIKVGMESILMHVDTVEYQEYEGSLYKMLIVSDDQDLFSGTIVCGIGHLTSFFPEKLMTRGKDYRVEGMRCYWRNGELVFKYGERDCDEVYEEWHNGIEEDGPSTGSGTFTIYPNPANNILIVETRLIASLPVANEYRITNLMGQTVFTGNLTAETQQIDVSALPQGMYFISVGDMTRKFVVR